MSTPKDKIDAAATPILVAAAAVSLSMGIADLAGGLSASVEGSLRSRA